MPHLIRIVRGIRGSVAMCMELVLRFDYGRTVPWVTRLEDGVLRAIAGPDMAVLYAGTALRGENLKTLSEFTVNPGESVNFVLSYGPSFDELPPPADPEQALHDTIAFWQEWTGRAHLRRRVCRRHRAFPDHAEGPDLSPHRRNRGRSHHLACRSGLADNETGTTASAGCAMPPSPCWP